MNSLPLNVMRALSWYSLTWWLSQTFITCVQHVQESRMRDCVPRRFEVHLQKKEIQDYVMCDGYEEKQITCWWSGAASSVYWACLTWVTTQIRHVNRPCCCLVESTGRTTQQNNTHDLLLHCIHCNIMCALRQNFSLHTQDTSFNAFILHIYPKEFYIIFHVETLCFLLQNLSHRLNVLVPTLLAAIVNHSSPVILWFISKILDYVPIVPAKEPG